MLTPSVTLHSITDFIDPSRVANPTEAEYWYGGFCPQTGEWLTLPRTALAEAIAHALMRQLATQNEGLEGKMYGVLLVETPVGVRVIKAFSGLLGGNLTVEGWVPPIPGRDRVALAEAHTLSMLEALKQQLIALQHLPARQHLAEQSAEFEERLQHLKRQHQQRQRDRQQQRQQLTGSLTGEALTTALEQLNDCSRRDGMELRRLKQQRDAVLHPLRQAIAQADAQLRELKHQRQERSRQLQAQMHAASSLTNFAGQSLSLQQLMPTGLPTGTGECCAPKLLHYAATQGWNPIAMAEFWWGQTSVKGDKVSGQFYGACAERCQPIMGFLLSGLTQTTIASNPLLSTVELPVVYEDEWLIAVNKPSGLLSVPGRYRDRQDSVVSRFSPTVVAVHRLDQDTSGLLLLARDQDTHRALSRQFQQRQIHKVYEAILDGTVTSDRGVIDLPLWSDPSDRPYQKVNQQQGKPSITEFQVIARTQDLTRVEFVPLTGRTHQLRVHAADAQGLGTPIWGDRLYGKPRHSPHNSTGLKGDRLHLHARELRFHHPHLNQPMHLHTLTPF